eukprot:s165_g42.t1
MHPMEALETFQCLWTWASPIQFVLFPARSGALEPSVSARSHRSEGSCSSIGRWADEASMEQSERSENVMQPTSFSAPKSKWGRFKTGNS